MLGVNENSLPYKRTVTYEMIKYLRLTRNLSQEKFGAICKIDQSVLAKLENNELNLTINYESRIMDGVRALQISNYELYAIRSLLDHKNNN